MTAPDLLMRLWRGMVDNANAEAMAFARGYAQALHDAGFLDDAQLDGWKARFERCPGHDSGRVWCAYCGHRPRVAGVAGG